MELSNWASRPDFLLTDKVTRRMKTWMKQWSLMWPEKCFGLS